MKKNIIIVALISMASFQCWAVADSHIRFYNLGRADFSLTTNYFKTDSNFSSSGNKSDLPAGSSFQILDITPEVRYVVLQDFAILSGANIGSAESADAIATRRNSSLNKIFIGADYQLIYSPSYNLFSEVTYSQSLETVKSNTDTALNNDGVNELTALLGTSWRWDSITPFAQAGFKYRSGGLSSLAIYSLGLESKFDGFSLGGSLKGFLSIKDDEQVNAANTRDSVTSRVNGYSKKFYSVNPSLIDSEVFLKLSYSKDLFVKAFAGYSLAGTSTANGYHVGFAMSWSLGGEEYRVSRPKKFISPKSNSSESSKTFKEDVNDGVNQEYFKPVSPAKEEALPNSEESIRMIKKNSSTMDASEASGSSNDYQIKLKKVKKKKKTPPNE